MRVGQALSWLPIKVRILAALVASETAAKNTKAFSTVHQPPDFSFPNLAQPS